MTLNNSMRDTVKGWLTHYYYLLRSN